MTTRRLVSLGFLAAALGAAPPAHALLQYVTVRAIEACTALRSDDSYSYTSFDEHGVVEASEYETTRLWCRIEVPEDMYISKATVYGRDVDALSAMHIYLRRAAYSSSSSTSIADWYSVTNDGSWDETMCHLVDKENYSYYLYVHIPYIGDAADLALWSFDIKFQDYSCE